MGIIEGDPGDTESPLSQSKSKSIKIETMAELPVHLVNNATQHSNIEESLLSSKQASSSPVRSILRKS